MAGMTFTKSSGLNDSVFGNSAEPIRYIMEHSAEAFENQSFLKDVFCMDKTNKWAEKYTSLTEMDDFEPVGENGSYVATDFQEGFNKTLIPESWKKSFSISKEMIEDGNLNLAKIRAKKMVTSYHRTRERFGAGLFMAAVSDKDLVVGGKKFGILGADGKNVFAKDHPSVTRPSLKQSNIFSNAFNEDVLGMLETQMQNVMDDDGNVLAVAPDTIIIPNDFALKKAVFQAIGSEKDPDTSNNGYNYQFGRWNVIIWPYWTLGAAEADKPFILLDSRFNQDNQCAIWLDRLELAVRGTVDDNTDAAVYRGRARWTAGFNNWRAFAVGGVSRGVKLT